MGKLTKIKFCRLQSGIKQSIAAKQLEISQPYLSQLESGMFPVDRELIVKMAKLYSCEVQDLL